MGGGGGGGGLRLIHNSRGDGKSKEENFCPNYVQDFGLRSIYFSLLHISRHQGHVFETVNCIVAVKKCHQCHGAIIVRIISQLSSYIVIVISLASDIISTNVVTTAAPHP
jgi:hypothetical protein